jgi:hypothetical protein
MQKISEKSTKKTIPEQLIPPDAIHTGDGVCFRPRVDGGVDLIVMSPTTGGALVMSELTHEEWGKVRRVCPWKPAPAVPVAPPVPTQAELAAQLADLQQKFAALGSKFLEQQQLAKPAVFDAGNGTLVSVDLSSEELRAKGFVSTAPITAADAASAEAPPAAMGG